MMHYITIEPLVNGEYEVRCSAGDFKKKYPSRNKAFTTAHLHVAGIDVDLLDLASAGKDDHD